MKILWVSNAPGSPSGYGTQTAQVGLRIAKAGYDIEFAANDGIRGDHNFHDLYVRGSGIDQYSRDTLREDVERSGADWVISLYDAWVYTEKGEDPFKGVRAAGWVPVDHYPAPPTLVPWLREHYAIAMSRYGFDRLMEASDQLTEETGRGFPVRYAPHALEDVYRPTEVAPSFEQPFRKMAGIPDDAFLVGIVAANTGTGIYDRKGFGDMVAALRPFMEAHEDVWVYFHTLQQGYQGMLIPMLLAVESMPADRIRWVDQHLLKKAQITDADMAAIYTAFDVLLATSRGEGFGLPVLEAQACGTPVIASNWTAQTELVGDAPWSRDFLGSQRHPNGWLVDVDRDYDPRQASWFGKPRISTIIRCLEDAYARRGEPALREAALAKAAGYRADDVFDEHWRPILAEMERALIAPNRETRRAAKRKAKVAA